MRTLLITSVLPFVAAGVALSAEKSPLEQARQRWLHGNHAEARAAFEKLLGDEATRVPAALGIARTWRDVGEHDEALKAVEAILPDGDARIDPDVLALKAELLYERGLWDEALVAAEAALGVEEEHFLARWVRARIYRDRGDIERADVEMRWFVRTYTRRSYADDDITDAETLALVGQAGAENARWHRLSDQFRFILNEVYRDALKADPDLWPVEYLAGMMLLEKYNTPGSLAAFDAALKINPRAADAMVGKGLAALQSMEITEASRLADAALKVNPNHVPALRLRADVFIAAGELADALEVLQRAREVNPKDAPTLARMAACHLLSRDQERFEAVVLDVEGFDRLPGVFYFELAETLNDQRIYGPAEGYYRKAMELRPNLLGPRGSLGLLYMRLGEEEQAESILKDAFKADPFNVRVANMLKVLRHLSGYETLATENFEIRYDPANDPVLARLLADDLETYYADLKLRFGYEPTDRILVEVFSRHEMFSGRTVALPDLHTIGACTGRVITMVSPKGAGVRKPFNWGRVMRHELTHVFNLTQTDFRVPHWLTEGLAVQSEGYARPREWSSMLAGRVESDELLNLDTIQLAFIRPRSHEEWTLAYCQSELYVEYLVKRYGEDVIARLLEAFRDGSTTAEVIRRVTGSEVAGFEAGYREYLAEVSAPFRGDGPGGRLMTLDELQKATRDDPEDDDLKAQLAYQFLRRSRSGDARDLSDAVLKKSPGHPLASVVRARLALADREPERAREVLKTGLAGHPEDARLLREMAALHVLDGEYAEAAKVLERGREVAPQAGGWLEELAKVYAKIDRAGELAAVLRELAREDADNLDVRSRLSGLLLVEGEYAEAEAVALDALRIDPANSDARETLLRALAGQGRDADERKYRDLFGGRTSGRR